MYYVPFAEVQRCLRRVRMSPASCDIPAQYAGDVDVGLAVASAAVDVWGASSDVGLGLTVAGYAPPASRPSRVRVVQVRLRVRYAIGYRVFSAQVSGWLGGEVLGRRGCLPVWEFYAGSADGVEWRIDRWE